MGQSPSQSSTAPFNTALPGVTLLGRIRKLREGFGFIAGDDGQDYFFHWTSIKKNSIKDFRSLELRDRVSFLPVPPRSADARGPRGIEVLYIKDED